MLCCLDTWIEQTLWNGSVCLIDILPSAAIIACILPFLTRSLQKVGELAHMGITYPFCQPRCLTIDLG